MTVLYATLLIILCLILVVIIIPQIIRSLAGQPPFVRTHKRAVSGIVEALRLKPNDVLYDLGCGNGRVLKAAIKGNPGVKGMGIEYNWFPVALAKLNVHNLPIQIRHESFFDCDLSDAKHIYCYLLPSTLEKLEPHLRASCKPGTRIVTCDFHFPTLIPIQEIVLSTAKKGPGKKLFVYLL